MWKQKLNLDTEIILKDLSQIEMVRASGEYDLVRRGVVLPTVDEAAGMAAIFGVPKKPVSRSPALPRVADKADVQAAKPSAHAPIEKGPSDLPPMDEFGDSSSEKNGIVTEEDAIYEIDAIPLYFPMAYSLVKPYVKGFEINGLDATTLKDISIDSNWQPKMASGGS